MEPILLKQAIKNQINLSIYLSIYIKQKHNVISRLLNLA